MLLRPDAAAHAPININLVMQCAAGDLISTEHTHHTHVHEYESHDINAC